MEEKKTELLECVLTEKELLDYGQQLSRQNKEVISLEAQKKATTSEFTAKVDMAKATIDMLSGKVSTGKEFRKVEISVEFNKPVDGKKKITRLDTGEVVRECNMTADELEDLFIEKKRKDEEEAEKKKIEESKPKLKKIKPKNSDTKNGDTMKVEKTLSDVNVLCDQVSAGKVIGCCQCEDEDCGDRDVKFGDAKSCECKVACSSGCPRLIKD